MFGNVRVTFGQVLDDTLKSLESGRKSMENRQKRCHQFVHNNKNITRSFEDMYFMFTWQEQSRSRQSNIKFTFSSHYIYNSSFFKIANMGYNFGDKRTVTKERRK